MQLKVSKLASAIAASVALAATSSVVQAGSAESEGASPNLNLGEKLLITAAEQHASLLAALAEAQAETGVANCAGTFSWAVSTQTNGSNATSTVDNHTLSVATVADNPSGTWLQTSDTAGEIGNTPIGDNCSFPRQQTMEGNFFFSNDGEIMYANADFCIGFDEWDEHVVKDIFVDPQNPTNEFGQRVVFDRGIEVITKKRPLATGSNELVGWPRAKWRQVSTLVKANGDLGSIEFRKVRVAPDGAPSCFISLEAGIDGDAGGFDSFAGQVRLTQLQ